jgi:hypothetical protein
MKIKMTNSVKKDNYLAGNTYEVSAKTGKKFIEAGIAVEVKNKKVKDGNR